MRKTLGTTLIAVGFIALGADCQTTTQIILIGAVIAVCWCVGYKLLEPYVNKQETV